MGQPTFVVGSQFSEQSATPGMAFIFASLRPRMQRPPGAVQSASVSQNLAQVLVVAVVLMQSRPALQSVPVHTWPLAALPFGPQAMPVASTEHCSPVAQPHWGTVSLHGSSAQAGPEPVDAAALLVEVGSLPVDVPLVPPLVVPVAGLPLAEVVSVVGSLVVVPPVPAALESPPAPPVVEAVAHPSASESKLLKKRSDRGRIRTPRERTKRGPEPTPVVANVNALRDPW